MKRIITVLLCVLTVCGLVACKDKTVSDTKIDYGNSKLYSKEDMNEAIKIIKDEFNTWDGCELHSIVYAGDDASNSDNVAWMNELEDANDAKETFTQCIVFKSSFHSPKEGGGAWNEDEEYTGWYWWLARSEDDTWKLMTCGY